MKQAGVRNVDRGIQRAGFVCGILATQTMGSVQRQRQQQSD